MAKRGSKAFPITLLCDVLGLSRSSFYYSFKAERDAQLRQHIEQIRLSHHRYGYRRITNELHRQGLVVNRKRVQRLVGELGLQVRPRRKRVITTNSQPGRYPYPNLLKDLSVNYPDQIWCADITYVPLAYGKMAYLALLFDVFTRTIRGWALSKEMSVKLLSEALRKALARQHRPQIHHSDRGGQYIAEKYCQQLRAIPCRISMTDRAKPWQNPYIESTIGRLKDEYIVDSEYQDFHDAYRQLCPVLDVVYNQQRPHSALGYRTPFEFEAQYMAHRHKVDKPDISHATNRTVESTTTKLKPKIPS